MSINGSRAIGLLGFFTGLLATVCLLTGCGSHSNKSNESLVKALFGPTETPTPPLAIGQSVEVGPGLKMAIIALQPSTCDNGQRTLEVVAEWTNSTASFIKDSPSLSVRSPDNQTLDQYDGIRGAASGKAYDGFLPQGFPPNATTRGYLCIANGGQPVVGKYVGTLPSTFGGWLVEADDGHRWLMK